MKFMLVLVLFAVFIVAENDKDNSRKPTGSTAGETAKASSGKAGSTQSTGKSGSAQTSGKPASKQTSEKPGQTTGKPVSTTGKVGATTGKSGDKTTGKPVSTTGKPGTTTGKSGDKTSGKPGAQTTGKPGAKTTGKSGDKTSGKPEPQTTGKPGAQTTRKPGAQTTGKKGATTGKSGAQTTLKPESFNDWAKRNGKKYASKGESDKAEKAYKENAARVAKINADPNSKFKLKLDEYADKTPEEFKKIRTGLKMPPTEPKKNSTNTNSNSAGDKFAKAHEKSAKSSKNVKASAGKNVKSSVPTSLDYTPDMSPVKNQGGCGSCWAHAVIAPMEYWSRKNGSNKIFSEQYLVDCDTTNHGCNGGWPFRAYKFMINNGIAESSIYGPYLATNDTCKSKPPLYYPPNALQMDPCGSEDIVKTMLTLHGPLVIAISTVTAPTFALYSSGVYDDAACSSDDMKLDHAVVVVGFGTDAAGVDYWILRNSWGNSWGESGYMRIARKGNICGVTNYIFTITRR